MRKIFVLKRDTEKYGPTFGSEGCRLIAEGKPLEGVGHMGSCQARIKDELLKTDNGKERVERARKN